MNHQLPPEPEEVRKANAEAFEIMRQASEEFAKLPYNEQRLCAGRSHQVAEVRELLPPRDPRTISDAKPASKTDSEWFGNLLGHMF